MSGSEEPTHLEGFNEQLVWFAFKGVCAEDDLAAYRERHHNCGRFLEAIVMPKPLPGPSLLC